MKPTNNELIELGCSCNAGQSCQRCDRLQGRLDVLEEEKLFLKELFECIDKISTYESEKVLRRIVYYTEEISKIKEVLK